MQMQNNRYTTDRLPEVHPRCPDCGTQMEVAAAEFSELKREITFVCPACTEQAKECSVHLN